jgi:glycosyltransferase involved in cell wall biosynthesis
MFGKGDVVLVGHPFTPIGCGENIRCTYHALRSVGVRPGVIDIYSLQGADGSLQNEIKSDFVEATGRVNIFHINGDEIPQAIAHIGAEKLRGKHNIIFPAWELEKYPLEWAKNLDLFDEIWAPTRFILDALTPVVTKPVYLVPWTSEVILSSVLGRRYFGIPESSYAFLFFFDFRSYAQRKNPEAVIESFVRLLELAPDAAATLVIKLNGVEQFPRQADALRGRLLSLRDRVVLIDQTITDNEIKNLVRCCDCFVSLHRSEGFGRGLSEAMFLGKPVIATGYSGNLGFMDKDNSLLVDYKMIDLVEGDYPHWEGQHWADADTSQAADYMAMLVRNPALGYQIGRRAAISIRKTVGFRATGLKYSIRINEALLHVVH